MHQSIVTNAVAEILAQHDQLRTMMDRCEQLADQVDVGKASPELLIREIAGLRVTLEQHLREEEQQLRPLLRDAYMTNDIRIERAFADHVGEHHAMAQRFIPGPTAELRETLASLRDHLENEERYFLQRLRPDVHPSQGMRDLDGSTR
jgi:hemerythrin-like domain-containing protein